MKAVRNTLANFVTIALFGLHASNVTAECLPVDSADCQDSERTLKKWYLRTRDRPRRRKPRNSESKTKPPRDSDSAPGSKTQRIPISIPLETVRDINAAAPSQLMRKATSSDYPGDGSGETIKTSPNPRMVSNACADGTSLPNDRGMSDMVWAWGQFLDHDISLTTHGPEFGVANIECDPADPLSPFIPFTRSRYTDNPREQVNVITPYIDASNVYGSDADRANALRAHQGGKLKTTSTKSKKHDLLPLNRNGLPNEGGTGPELFLAGDVRANEQVGLLAMHTLFVREHNRLAERIQKLVPGDDEQIYQLARKIVGAEMQVITYKEFLPALLGNLAPSLDDYDGYKASLDPPLISNEFSTALFRFGHSMLSPSLTLANKKGRTTGSLPLKDAFFNQDFIKNNPENVDALLSGFANAPAQEIDNVIVDDVRNFLFGSPGNGGLDLASLNIQRGRDHGIPSYNEVRKAYGLPEANAFSEISSKREVQDALQSVYTDADAIDAWIGALAEDHIPGAAVGELIAAGLREQFTRLRDGDKFFYLNDEVFKKPGMRAIIDIERWTLSDVIQHNTNFHYRKNVFRVPH